jgi:hypothetical protein
MTQDRGQGPTSVLALLLILLLLLLWLPHVVPCCRSDKNMPYRDTKGFRKQVVVLTAPGKLLALHNGDGRVLWSTYLPQLASAEAHQVVSASTHGNDGCGVSSR